MTTIFLSHSNKDKNETELIKDWLEADERGHWVFLDANLHTGIKGGENWEQTLYEQLRNCRVFLPVTLDPTFDTSSLFSDLQQTPIDLSKTDQTGYQRLERGLQEQFPRGAPKRSPYPGLLAFPEDETAIYNGRDTEVTSTMEVLEGLRRRGPSAPHFVLLLGASGSGTSSLVRAGLIPRLRLKGGVGAVTIHASVRSPQ